MLFDISVLATKDDEVETASKGMAKMAESDRSSAQAV